MFMSWDIPENYTPSIYLDLFPSRVVTPGAMYSKARTILTHDTLFVFVDSADGPTAAIVAPYSPQHIYGDTRTGFDLYVGMDPENSTIASVVAIRPEQGCGCGTRLKAFRPFSTLRQSPLPSTAGPLPAPPVA